MELELDKERKGFRLVRREGDEFRGACWGQAEWRFRAGNWSQVAGSLWALAIMAPL